MLRYHDRLKMLFLIESIWNKWYPGLALISTVVVFATFAFVAYTPGNFPWP